MNASTATTPVILTYAASVWALVGLIWFVQVVHYPLFADVAQANPDAFAAYEKRHASLTSLVVAPLMFAELATTILLLFVLTPAGVSRWLLWAGFATVFVNWMSTAFLQVPQHNRLAEAFDAAAHGTLVTTNWLRVAAWTAHGLIAAALLWQWSSRATLPAA